MLLSQAKAKALSKSLHTAKLMYSFQTARKFCRTAFNRRLKAVQLRSKSFVNCETLSRFSPLFCEIYAGTPIE